MIRVGVIGLGFGAAVHVPAFASLPGVQVVALGGQRSAKARELASGLGIAFGGTIDEVLGAGLDAVTIALPPEAGAQVAQAALARRLAVMAEKPLAHTVERAEALARLAEGCTTAVGFELAELECFQALKRALESQARPGSVRLSWCTRSYAHSNRIWNWKTDRRRHGGVMNLLGSHILYLAEWLFGPLAEIRATYSDERTAAFAPPGEQPAEDRASLQVVTAGGVRIGIELDNAAGESGMRWELELPQGRLLLEERAGGGLALSRTGGATPDLLASDVPPPGQDWRIAPFRRLAGRFADCVPQRAACTPDFRAGARVQRLLEFAAESARRNGASVAC